MTGILEGKRAVITGGSRGLGLAIARAFLESGASVAIAARGTGALEKAVEELRATGGEVRGIPCDVGSYQDVQNLADQVIKTWGHFDVWINNAGISSGYGPTWKIPMDRIEQVINTNIKGVAFGSWLAVNHFETSGKGVLINLLGQGSDNNSPMQNAYGASKRWTKAFTKSLAEELKDSNIRVFSFNPGLVYTDLVEEVQAVEGYRGRLEVFSKVLAFLGSPPEAPASRVVWLASDASENAPVEQAYLSRLEMMARGLFRGLLILLGRREGEHPITIETIDPAPSPFDGSIDPEGGRKK